MNLEVIVHRLLNAIGSRALTITTHLRQTREIYRTVHFSGQKTNIYVVALKFVQHNRAIFSSCKMSMKNKI